MKEAIENELKRVKRDLKVARLEAKIASNEFERTRMEAQFQLVMRMLDMGFVPKGRKFVRPVVSPVPDVFREQLRENLPKVVPGYRTHRITEKEIIVFRK